MASQTGKWREESILIVCPGSQTTMAQLGCSELTPPSYRFPTRMFQDEDGDEWRPYHTYKRKKPTPAASLNGDAPAEGKDEDDLEWVEDQDSTEGAVYPIQGGRIVNMDAFLAFLDHVHHMLTSTYHNTPIMLMASPQWTRPDCETIARYIFEKTRTPALCLLHSGIATQYGLKYGNMTIVDIGYEKVDVTCLYDSRVVGYMEVGKGACDISGGEVFTRKLLQKLKDKGFSYDMAEQLKKSHICEVLPYAPEAPGLMELPVESATADSAAPASVGTAPDPAPPKINEPQAKPPVATGEVGDEEMLNGENKGDEDGVLDVASIVTSGNTKEFLAKKEKEKAERAKHKKGPKGQEGADGNAPKTARLPNSKRVRNTFHYDEVVTEDVIPTAKENGATDPEMTDSAKTPDSAPAAPANGESAAPSASASETTAQAAADGGNADGEKADGEAAKEESQTPAVLSAPAPAPESAAAAPASAAAEAPLLERHLKRTRRDIEVGLERFTFAERAEIDRIVTAIYRAVQGIEDMYMRPACWESIVFVGNGARLRGLKDNIMQTLQARHLVSPSTATIFSSELPSNVATPTGTGSQTPTGSFTGPLPTSSSVNPLLQAATTASLAVPGAASAAAAAAAAATAGSSSNAGDAAGGQHTHHFHSQTPTSIKAAALPTYLAEWTKNGFEEAMFLGAQVAARLAFCVHNMDAQGTEAQRLMSLSRIEYNDLGPKGIRTHSMLG